MGYLDNTTITVDAILTQKGRELLARNNGSFQITQFALGDDEIDYTLFNENHPNGTQYSGEAIENMPLIEAMPLDTNMLLSKLITLRPNSSKIPFISTDNDSGISIAKGYTGFTLMPKTFYFDGSSNTGAAESGGYIFTVVNSELVNTWEASMSSQAQSYEEITSGLYTSYQTMGTTLTFDATTTDGLFSTSVTSLSTSIIIEGMSSGARITIPLTITS
tara:strand:- start:644 stop:1300 length:657 start_codon:yes stop_codon:yes gene_type:complete